MLAKAIWSGAHILMTDYPAPQELNRVCLLFHGQCVFLESFSCHMHWSRGRGQAVIIREFIFVSSKQYTVAWLTLYTTLQNTVGQGYSVPTDFRCNPWTCHEKECPLLAHGNWSEWYGYRLLI